MVRIKPTAVSPLAVSAASVAVMLLASSVTVYFYSSYARPETVAAGAYEKEIFGRISNINAAVNNLKQSYLGKMYFTAPTTGKVSLILEAEPVLPKNPVTDYFDSLDNQIIALNAENNRAKLETESVANIGMIEEIKFRPHSATLEHEIKDDVVSAEEEPTDKVIVKQVGLALGTPQIRSSVYRIQNIFGNAGTTGHIYMLEARKSDWDGESLESFSSTNFSSKDDLDIYLNSKKLLATTSRLSDSNKSTLKKMMKIDFSSSRNVEDYLKSLGVSKDDIESLKSALSLDFSSLAKLKESLKPKPSLISATQITDKMIEYICFNCPNGLENFIKYSIKPEMKFYRSGSKHLINPYKWLYLSTKIGKEVKHSQPIIIIAYPYTDDPVTKRIIYPEDVNLFQIDSLASWDINIYEADEQRVLNHCKKMLTTEDIEDIDQVNKTN